MSCAASEVSLEGVIWDIDPESYTLLAGTRRGSVHQLIDGTTAFQDRGFAVGDGTINLQGTFTDLDVIKALWELYASTPGVPMTFTDYKGNSFQVLFTPGEESFTLTPIQGSSRAFEYSMSLRIISVNQWFNSSSGPY